MGGLFHICTEELHGTCGNVSFYDINSSKMWGERMRNVYGTYQNVNRVSDRVFVKVSRANPYIYIYIYIYIIFLLLEVLCG